ncbi:MAG: hypothetical protein DWH81_11145 [Planctomycetota bacterium]|nr:MAG: hypothetical protein DWH81_11145 [Planctomycetota bacterium]
MLVATTLVVLMMLMFAQIYLAAISSLGRQQASSRNDTKARLADLLLRGDLQRASYRTEARSNQGLIPLVKGDVPSQMQKGFFYLSENDQTNPTDDVLHFTTYITRGVRNRDPSYYFGRCEEVPNVLKFEQTPANAWEYSNHPEIDDGDTSNQVGSSRAAEVTYFVRGGNLYRRVLLVRDLELSGRPALNSAQPSKTTAVFNSRIVPGNSAATPSYYKAFDYSAFCQVNVVADPTQDIVRFLGVDAFSNLDDASESLGRSFTRFGFAQTATNQLSSVSNYIQARGVPIEYDDAGVFFGRPIHAETGSFQWRWPGERFNPLLEPLSFDIQRNRLSVSGTPVVDPDSLKTRESEDLLLSNVESFDVEVWDSGRYEYEDLNNNGVLDSGEDANLNGVLNNLGDLNLNDYQDIAEGFVQLGHDFPTGYFRDDARLNPHYGPGADPNTDPRLGVPVARRARNWVFDTGHPDMWTEDPGQQNTAAPALTNWFKPPYRPLLYRLTEDVNNNGTLDTGEDLNANGFLDIPVFPSQSVTNSGGAVKYWTPSTRYLPGDVVFKPGSTTSLPDTSFSIAYRCVASGEDRNGDGLLGLGEDGSQGEPNSLHTAGTLDWAQSGATPPNWNQVLGERTIESTRLHGPNVAASDFSEDTNNNSILDLGEDANGNGQLDLYTPSSLTWQAFDNRVGLKKIRITLRVRDPIEGTARQFSIVHSFANPDN